MMDMHAPPAYVQMHVQTAQVETQSPPLVITPDESNQTAPIEPVPVKVDVSKYIPSGAVAVTILLTLTPPTGQALVYTEGGEKDGTVFKGARSAGDIRLDGRYIYVKLYGATSFDIQYLNYRVP